MNFCGRPATLAMCQTSRAFIREVLAPQRHLANRISGLPLRPRISELVGFAAEMRKRAERRIGELMEDDRKAGKLPEGRPKKRVAGKPVFMAEATATERPWASTSINASYRICAFHSRHLAAIERTSDCSRCQKGMHRGEEHHRGANGRGREKQKPARDRSRPPRFTAAKNTIAAPTVAAVRNKNQPAIEVDRRGITGSASRIGSTSRVLTNGNGRVDRSGVLPVRRISQLPAMTTPRNPATPTAPAISQR